MAKIQFSDVVPPERRSIRDIPIPNSGKRKVPIVIKPEATQSMPKSEPVAATDPVSSRSSISAKISELTEKTNSGPYEYYYPKNNQDLSQHDEDHGKFGATGKPVKKRRFLFGGIALVVIVAFVFSMMTVFASATILIVPKSQDVDVSLKLEGTIEADPSSVRYEVVKLSKSNTVSVPATGEESVEIKAHGKIVIYNNFSTESQRLIVRTRFESPGGLIYRIPESVMVPGQLTKNGVVTPGSVEVEVFADEAGEKYNINKTDFTIPGFKNDAGRYKNFYARSSSDMAGGFIGKRKTVSEDAKKAALQNMDNEIQDGIKKELASKVPEGLTLLNNSFIYSSTDLPQQEDSSSVVIGKEGTIYAIMLNSKDLSEKITTAYIRDYPGWGNIVSAINDFSLLNMVNKPSKIEANQEIEFEVSGKAQILADIDTNLISQKLSGVPKKETQKLLDEFAGISSITATIRPVWKQSFPTNPLKINVKMATAK